MLYDVHRHKTRSTQEKAVYGEAICSRICCWSHGGVLIDEWIVGNVLKAKAQNDRQEEEVEKKTRLIKPSKKRV